MRSPALTFCLLLIGVTACNSQISEQDKIRQERAAIRAEYGVLFDEVSEILFEADPVGINFETNTDEYEPEVGTILPRLVECHSSTDVRRVVHEEFVRWFDADIAGPIENYTEIADQIWQAVKSHESAH